MDYEAWKALPEEEKNRRWADPTLMSETEKAAIWAERQRRMGGAGTPAAEAAPVPVPGAPEGEAPPEYETGGFTAFMSGLGQGVTFGLSDELRARLLAAGPTGYREELERIRAEGQALQEAHPNLRNAGQVAGAVAPMLIPGVGAAATGARLAGTGARVAATAGTGAAMGGLSGWGHGTATDVAGQLTDAGTGAAIGGATGVAGGAFFNKIGQMMGAQTSRALEREIAKIATSTGRSTDEIVAAVAAGEDLASQGIEVSATMRAAINRMRSSPMPAGAAAPAATTPSTAATIGKALIGPAIDMTTSGLPIASTAIALGKPLMGLLQRNGLSAADAAQGARILIASGPENVAMVEAALQGKIPGREIAARAMALLGAPTAAAASAAGAQAPGTLDMLEGGF